MGQVEIITGRKRRRSWSKEKKLKTLERAVAPDAHLALAQRRSSGQPCWESTIWRRLPLDRPERYIGQGVLATIHSDLIEGRLYSKEARMREGKRLHIVGCSPRSGTTLIFELVTACFDIVRFGEHEMSLFNRPQHARGPYCSKQPTELVHAARVLRWDPSLHVIYMLRDPRDVVVSQHSSHPDRYWCDFDLWERNQRIISHLATHPRVLIVKYEILTQDPAFVQQRICERFSFLDKTHDFRDFDRLARPSDSALRALGGLRKISTASIGVWRQNLPRVAQQVQVFPSLPNQLIASGYERDHNWLAILHGVMPEHAVSVRSENDPLKDIGDLQYWWQRIKRRGKSLLSEVRYVMRLGPRESEASKE